MKKRNIILVIFIVFMIVVLVFLLIIVNSKNTNAITLNYENSFFSDFAVEEGRAKLFCHLVLSNNSELERTIQISGLSSGDYKAGLITSERLRCISLDEKTGLFSIPPEAKDYQLDVIFVGEYGGNYEKQNRLLPETIIITDTISGIEYVYNY